MLSNLLSLGYNPPCQDSALPMTFPSLPYCIPYCSPYWRITKSDYERSWCSIPVYPNILDQRWQLYLAKWFLRILQGNFDFEGLCKVHPVNSCNHTDPLTIMIGFSLSLFHSQWAQDTSIGSLVKHACHLISLRCRCCRSMVTPWKHLWIAGLRCASCPVDVQRTAISPT